MSADILDTAILAARRAGEYLKNAPKISLQEQTKESSHSIVTVHDLEVERIIIETIRESDTDARVLSEEMEDRGAGISRPFWVIDPLDGTSYFVRGLGSYSVSIGFVDDQGVRVGVVFCPATDEMFEAERGAGAYLNGDRIRVSDIADPREALFTFSHRFLRESWKFKGRLEMVKTVRSIRGGGSCAQELAYLAAGRIDAFIALSQSLWDYAAGLRILEEAGGRISNLTGRAPSLEYVEAKSEDIVATNGLLHTWCLGRLGQT